MDDSRAAASPPFERGPDGIVTMRNVLPDWAVRMLVGTLLLPALLTALDGWFRARRRKLPAGRWAAWLAAGALAPLLAWLWLRRAGPHRGARRPRHARRAGRLPVRDRGGDRDRLRAADRRRRLVRAAAADRRAARARRERGRRRARRRHRPRGQRASPSSCGCSTRTRRRCCCPRRTCGCWPGPRTRGCAAPAAALPVLAGVALPVLVVVHYAGALDLDPLALAWLATLATADGHVSPARRARPRRCGCPASAGCSPCCARGAGWRPKARARAAA